MDKKQIRTIISEGQEYIGEIELVRRNVRLEENGNYVFVGVRQSGKSYLLYQKIQDELSRGIAYVSSQVG